MKKLFPLTIYCLLFTSAIAQTDYSKYADPFIGTGGHGHTFPGAVLPHGMVQLSPDTRIDGSWDGCSGYHYSDSVLYGFSHTHLSGTGCSDYGDILLLPFTGKYDPKKKYSSRFHHQNEKASPGFYSVHLDDGNTDVELTATERTGFHKYTYNGNDGFLNILLDLTHRDKTIFSSISDDGSKEVCGERISEAWAKEQKIFFCLEFSKALDSSFVESDSIIISPEPPYIETLEGKTKGVYRFKMKKGESIYVKIGISGVDIEGAKKNLDAELPGWDFEKVKAAAKAAWNKELSKIEVSGGTADQMKIFYTALYHTAIHPSLYSDVDGRYMGRDFKIHTANGFDYYTVFSLWDTFRAEHPLFTIIDRKRTVDYIKTFLAQYEQGGLLPVWELSSNETECMIGYHSVSVIADAMVKGISGFDYEEAFNAMMKSAESRDRYGLGAYMDHGYLSMEDENESVSKTLEYAYDDWCIAQVANLLHHEEDYKKYNERSQSWKNLFDYKTGFIRPRKNGGWMEPFDPREVNNNYTEANAWQYNFFVPQDPNSFISAYNGGKKLEKKLDDFFSTDSKTTGREQADISGLIGQYAHGNEPSHHIAYMYDLVGADKKTQKLVHQIMNEMYHPYPDGLIGNEDCGQMSAWYVMSALGFYPVCPGSHTYQLGTPLFPDLKIHLENGKIFEVVANGLDNKNFYVKDALLNKKSFMQNFLQPHDYENGGVLCFNMTNDSVFHSNENNLLPFAPPAVLESRYVTSPVILSVSQSFKNKMQINIKSAERKIFYTLDVTEPTLQSKIFNPQSPIIIDSSCFIKAIAVSANGRQSKVTMSHFYKMPHPNWSIKILTKYSPQYSAAGDEGIIDGIRGDVNWRKGNWQGYQSQDFECVIDLGKEQNISECSAGFLQDTRAWILYPKKVSFSFSMDGKNFSDSLSVENRIADRDLTPQIQDLKVATQKNIKARFVKVRAVNYGKLPEWHQGFPYNGDAHIFIDEVEVR